MATDHIIGNPDFIHLRILEGRWCFVNAEGEPFIYKGVTSINRAGGIGGRRSKETPYLETCNKLYGTESDEPFVESVLEKMRLCEFNAMGAWTTKEFFDRGFYYTETCESLHDTGLDKDRFQVKGPGINLPDFFSTEWEEAYDQAIAELAPERVGKPEFLGWFTDNEPGWGQANADHVWGGGDSLNARGALLLQFALNLKEERPFHQAALRFLEERHGSIEAALATWEIDRCGTLGELRRLTEAGQIFQSKGYAADHEAFTYMAARTYHDKVGAIIRKYDPHHLILGCRFGGPPGKIIGKACYDSPYLDVITVNNYQHIFYERVDEVYQTCPMPILNGEISWNSDYFGWRHSTHDLPTDKLDKLGRTPYKAQEALERAIVHPALVGYTFYRWVHNFEDPEGAAYGITNRSADELNRYNQRILAKVNPRLEDVAFGRVPYTRLPLLETLGLEQEREA